MTSGQILRRLEANPLEQVTFMINLRDNAPLNMIEGARIEKEGNKVKVPCGTISFCKIKFVFTDYQGRTFCWYPHEIFSIENQYGDVIWSEAIALSPLITESVS